MGLLHGWKTCPRCETPLVGEESHLHCPGCGSTYYANSAPCVSALVEDAKGRLLLLVGRSSPTSGSGTVPAGSSRRASTRSTGFVASSRRRPGCCRAGALRRRLDGRLRRRARRRRHARTSTGRSRWTRGSRSPRTTSPSSAGSERTSSGARRPRVRHRRGRARGLAQGQGAAGPIDPPGDEARCAGPRAREGSVGESYAATRPSERSIAPFGCAPITAAEGSPSRNRISVGMEATP